MKIIALENQTPAELEKLFAAEGISTKRLSGALGASYLPKFGKFENFAIDGEEEKKDGDKVVSASTKHIRIGTKGMQDSISLSRLQLDIFVGEVNESKYAVSAKGNYYLPANTVVNPALKGNQANVVHKMIGKFFTAQEIEGVTTGFSESGFKSPEDVVTKPVKNYRISLFKTEAEAKDFAATFEK